MMTAPVLLKLQARDSEDIAVVSAVLQDAIVAVRDMAYQPEQRQFIFAASRFCWEKSTATPPVHERINCAVTIAGVTAVQAQAIDQNNKDGLHELLALLLETDQLRLVFAGGAQLRLTVTDWSLRLEDFGAAWPVPECPCHAAAESEDT